MRREQVQSILNVLPPDGNLLVWGLGYDSPFWDRATKGRVIFLEDAFAKRYAEYGAKTWFQSITAKQPYLEAYKVTFSTTNDAFHFDHFVGHPDHWKFLELSFIVPEVVRQIHWNVVLVDGPGLGGAGPGRLQSLYMTKILVEDINKTSTKESSLEQGAMNVTTHVFVGGFESQDGRMLSQQVFGKAPFEVIRGEDASEMAHYAFDETAFRKELASSVLGTEFKLNDTIY
jgi:Polysaccharide biosynthesis